MADFKYFVIFILFALCETFGHETVEEGPIVTTIYGKLQGSVMKSDNGRDIFAFRGIPYAKPPVGRMRFKTPQPVDPWRRRTLNATVDGNICVQVDTLITGDVFGVEDCLTLNVYMPQLPTHNESQTFAVMVYIHGGTYLTGGSTSRHCGPQRLLDWNVILVTLNYRLGPFGFLSTEDDIAPGNFGLWDQSLALHWVHYFIHAFGGDPKRVTVFGESAGAGSTAFHIISPYSKEFFSAAIYQSGTAVTKRSIELNPLKYTKRLAENLDCSTNSSEQIIQCLKSKSAVDILTKGVLNYRGKGEQSFSFAPVIDSNYGGSVFVPDVPEKLLANGKFNTVPVMGGTMKDEGIFYYLNTITKTANFSDDEDIFSIDNVRRMASKFVPDLMVDKDKGPLITNDVIDQYFKDVNQSDLKQVINRISNFISDSFINEWTDSTNEMIAAAGVPVYAYKITYHGDDSILNQFRIKNPKTVAALNDLGVVLHGDDLQYLFHWEHIFPKTELLGNDRLMADIMLAYWTNFAKTGKPSLDGLPFMNETIEWPVVVPGHYSYLNLTLKPGIVHGKLCSEPALWNKALKQIRRPEERNVVGLSSMSSSGVSTEMFSVFHIIKALFRALI